MVTEAKVVVKGLIRLVSTANVRNPNPISRPLVERKRLLDELHLFGPAWATNGSHQGDGETLFKVCAELGHEGVVAKRLDAPYLSGIRSRTWLKRKTPDWKREHAPHRRPRVRS
jgi:ATP-dependent DNA ligase